MNDSTANAGFVTIPKPVIEVKKTIVGWTARFTIGVQTFSLGDLEDEERATWFGKQLETAFSPPQLLPTEVAHKGDEKEFDAYCTEARDAFCNAINGQKWNSGLRTEAENILICFDQLRDRWQQAAPKLPSDEEVASWFVDNIGHEPNDCSAGSAIYKFRLWLKERATQPLSDGNKLLLSIIKNETMDTELATTKAALQLEKEPEDRWIAVSERLPPEIEQLFRDNFDCYADNSTDGADGQIVYGEDEPAMTLPVFIKLYKALQLESRIKQPLTK
jgi:hypothetical protein